MPIFTYVGKNSSGNEVKGEIEGVSVQIVGSQLMKSGVYPLSIQEKKSTSNTPIFYKKNKKSVDLIIFTRQMYTLIKSGVPLSKALKTMENSNQNPTLKTLFKDIKTQVDNGYQLSAAFQKYNHFFSPFYINMVKVGELTGRLEEIFLKLYEYLEFEQTMIRSAKSALRYPALVIIAITVAFSIMMVFVVPTFAKVYAGFNAKLPWQTQMLINISEFMVAYSPILILGFGFVIYSLLKYLKTADGRLLWGKIKFNIPIIGPILKKSALARFCKTFALSIKSGIPIVQALSYISPVLDNDYLTYQIDDIRQNVEKGNTLYASMANSQIFEPLVLEMFATGEETGELDAMSLEVSSLYEKEVEYELKNINALIEPVMIVLLAGLILVFALGIFLPIWDLTKIVK